MLPKQQSVSNTAQYAPLSLIKFSLELIGKHWHRSAAGCTLHGSCFPRLRDFQTTTVKLCTGDPIRWGHQDGLSGNTKVFSWEETQDCKCYYNRSPKQDKCSELLWHPRYCIRCKTRGNECAQGLNFQWSISWTNLRAGWYFQYVSVLTE